MAEITKGAIVRLSGTAVPPLLEGLYGEVTYASSDAEKRCGVRVWNWNTDCLTWRVGTDLVPLEPDSAARLQYAIYKDGDLPGWRGVVEEIHRAWADWAHLMSTWGRTNIQNDWYAKSLDHILQDVRTSERDLNVARGQWGGLLAAQMKLVREARGWVEE